MSRPNIGPCCSRPLGLHIDIARTAAIIAALGLSLLSLATSAKADALDNWRSSNIITNIPYAYPPGLTVSHAAYGNGRFVIVGSELMSDFGFIQSSDDGMTWTNRFGNSIYDLLDVAYGQGIFVAVGWDWYGGQNLYSSTNGVNWTARTNATVSTFYGVTFTPGLFVAVGDGTIPGGSITTNRNIYTSSNGTNWTGRASGAPPNDVHAITGVAYGAGRFVGVDGYGYTYTSTTGITWTRSLIGANPPPASSYGGSISFCNDRFIVLSGAATNLVSLDGVNWSAMVKDKTNLFTQVLYGNGLYVGLAGTNLLTSTNGTNWVLRNLQVLPGGTVTGLALSGRNLLAVGHKATYAPTVSSQAFAYISDPFVDVGINAGFPPSLQLSGLQGRTYRVDYSDTVVQGSNNWKPLTTVLLTNSPSTLMDTNAPGSNRFYRAALLP